MGSTRQKELNSNAQSVQAVKSQPNFGLSIEPLWLLSVAGAKLEYFRRKQFQLELMEYMSLNIKLKHCLIALLPKNTQVVT